MTNIDINLDHTEQGLVTYAEAYDQINLKIVQRAKDHGRGRTTTLPFNDFCYGGMDLRQENITIRYVRVGFIVPSNLSNLEWIPDPEMGRNYSECDPCGTEYGFFYDDGRGNNGSCYLASPEPFYWDVARNFCISHDGDLVSIETKGEQNHLEASFLKKEGIPLPNSFWTSARFYEGIGWVWQATGEKVGYENWCLPHLPNLRPVTGGLTLQRHTMGWYHAWVKTLCTALCERAAKCQPTY